MRKLSEPIRHEDANLRRFAELVLGTAVEVLVNSIATFVNGQVRFQELLAKKGAQSLTEPGEIDDWIKHHSLLIAHYLTCRQLDDFLSGTPPGKHRDDGYAWQYFPNPEDWAAEFSRIPTPPRVVRDRVNKALLHLTFSDPLLKSNSRLFSVDYTIYVLRGLELFLRRVEGGPVDESFRARALESVVKFRAAFEPMVEANTREWRARGGVPQP